MRGNQKKFIGKVLLEKWHLTIQFLLFPFWPKTDFVADPIHPYPYTPDGLVPQGCPAAPCAWLSFLQAMLLLPWGQELNTPQQQPSTTNWVGVWIPNSLALLPGWLWGCVLHWALSHPQDWALGTHGCSLLNKPLIAKPLFQSRLPGEAN